MKEVKDTLGNGTGLKHDVQIILENCAACTQRVDDLEKEFHRKEKAA